MCDLVVVVWMWEGVWGGVCVCEKIRGHGGGRREGNKRKRLVGEETLIVNRNAWILPKVKIVIV